METRHSALMPVDQQERFESSMLQFIRTELEMGTTFAHLALNNKTGERFRRNRQNARKAFDTAMRFLKAYPLRDASAQDGLLTQVAILKDLLHQLGDKFEE